VVLFFASYLVGRSTMYAWNAFKSGPRPADVGVGQGSALSPVLSALCLAPIMRLFLQHAHACGLLSYVDDGTLIVQSKSLDTNITALQQAYAVIFQLFTQFALVLEHDKSEIFHFDRSQDKYNPSIDLGFAPYTGATPLKPKPFWRYLGFYFDRKLTFHEHVRYYSTKAISSVKAMKMLGSSTRGLDPYHKRLLYRSCVVPIATYGYRLWYFNGARCKGAEKLLQQMQRKAALWITGAFSTSPTGGVEALAGLLPIHFLLQRLGASCR
jgi:Reverse transcriptase (RNA-dependent DNA polymerase)